MSVKTRQVDFRELTKRESFTRDARHSLHSYPAKLLPNIPYFFLHSGILKDGGIVLDPFCGTGTVLLEASLSGRKTLGAEINPLATMITEVKMAKLGAKQLQNAHLAIKGLIPKQHDFPLPTFPNIDHWFYPHVQEQLQRLLEAVEQLPNAATRKFMLLCYSSTVRQVSLADPRLSVPVRLRHDQYDAGHMFYEQTNKRLRKLKRINVFRVFDDTVIANISRIAQSNFQGASRFDGLANSIATLPDYCKERNLLGKIDSVITSPPYCGAQKYLRSTSLQLYWLGLVDKEKMGDLHAHSLGREHYPKEEYSQLMATKIPDADSLLADIFEENPLRAHIASHYLIEMFDSLKIIWKCLRNGGKLVLVMGNNTICNREFRTSDFVTHMAKQIGFKMSLHFVDDIRSRGLMTARNKTASIINSEHVLVFQKI